MVELEQLERIDKYLQVLIEAYPTPLSQTQIADRAAVSKAAVSQIREHLYEICDVKTLIYKKKLVLKNDNETIFTLFAYFFYAYDAITLQQIIIYEYFNILLHRDIIYRKILEQNEEYSFEKYFTKDDFEWFLNFLKNKIINYEKIVLDPEIQDETTFDIGIDYLYEYLPFGYMLSNYIFLKDAIVDKNISFLNEKEDFIKLLTLRDKIHYIILENLESFDPIYQNIIEYLEVKSKKEKTEMYGIYHQVIRLFVKKIFKLFTEFVFEEIDRQGLNINKKFREIGSLFKP